MALRDRYFQWMCDILSMPQQKSYKKLLEFLHSTEFYYTIGMDSNRMEDGIDMRYYFGGLHRISDARIANELDIVPCSVLEMMFALAFRCETHITYCPELGDRTAKWFWVMIDSLGLGDMYDERFDKRIAQDKIDIFLKREYTHDGEGGLFHIENCEYDLRSVEIWYQLMWYLVAQKLV